MGELYLRDNVPGSAVYMAINVWQVINTSGEPAWSLLRGQRKVPEWQGGPTGDGLRVPWGSAPDKGVCTGRAVVAAHGVDGVPLREVGRSVPVAWL